MTLEYCFFFVGIYSLKVLNREALKHLFPIIVSNIITKFGN